ncbi:MAG TPA: hypothetical protein VMZ11_01310 [Mycobacteriales bacterium]|nr:hypothetical protein [Mycobacteriales bacterium]
MNTTRRSAGLGLLVYGLGTAVAFMSTGSPGGDYEDSTVAAYTDTGHWPVVAALAYLGAFSALAFLAFAGRMRNELGDRGDLFWGLSVAGTAAAVVGWMLVAGIQIAFAEGGAAVTALPHPVIYMLSEMSNLVAVCASALLIGTAAIVLATKATLPTPARYTTYAAGAFGIIAPAFFPLFLFWLWAIGMGGWLAMSDRSAALAPHPQLA